MINKLEYKKRIQLTQEKLKSNTIDTLLISEEEDIYYLTGLTYKSLERLVLLIIKEYKVVFIVTKMELAHLKNVDNITVIKSYWEYPATKPERWEDILLQEVKQDNLIGISSKSPFEISNFLTSNNLNIPENAIIEKQRWIKSGAEIKLSKLQNTVI